MQFCLSKSNRSAEKGNGFEPKSKQQISVRKHFSVPLAVKIQLYKSKKKHTVKPAYVVISIRGSPVLSRHIFEVP